MDLKKYILGYRPQIIIISITVPPHSRCNKTISPKTARGSIWPLPCGFSKNISSKERVKLWFFVTFNIILGHIFRDIFVDLPQDVQKIWRISLSILAIFIFCGFFWHFLFTKKLMKLAYNRWCQHFFTFSILLIDCLATV